MDSVPQDSDGSTFVAPELYLRLTGETLLLAADQHSFERTLGKIASAFAAIGLLPSELVETIVEDYNLAAELRHMDNQAPFGMWPPQPAIAVQPPSPPVVARIIHSDPRPDGDIPYAVLG